MKFGPLCDQFRKLNKKHLSDKEKKQWQDNALLTLRQYKLDGNAKNTNYQL